MERHARCSPRSYAVRISKLFETSSPCARVPVNSFRFTGPFRVSTRPTDTAARSNRRLGRNELEGPGRGNGRFLSDFSRVLSRCGNRKSPFIRRSRTRDSGAAPSARSLPIWSAWSWVGLHQACSHVFCAWFGVAVREFPSIKLTCSRSRAHTRPMLEI